ncbi:uncharacterized protein B0I36DRAFT_364655 [Microdochium trichocladiopsis]|uniref:2EXR domain-containing protein n=1 Tax=Microdochium trichocladiopsis TaxID=1682393 RepID=A0A9P9BKW6_9PEZI|nr:uncharacterized protein B0I36DRAFT_364655 [Microdochium trichocladiopsis]KAH7027457.1 hypothetical protein B0I36DRAFT_364655 [Microdochium trichocladiopsis]
MSAAQFHLFGRLPAELQDLIWQFALPEPRVYEVFDAPAPSIPRSNPANHLLFADIRNERPPVISNVCHGARSAVMRRYKPVVLSGTIKFLDLQRDVLLFDSYLQVRRLLKAIRLLSQVDVIRKHISQIALGTSWGLHAGLQLRLFHRSVQTKRNMAKLLKHLTQFQKLEAVKLVVYQRSAFSLQVQWLDQRCFQWSTTPTPAPIPIAMAGMPTMQRPNQHHQSPPPPRIGSHAGAVQNQAFHYNFHVNFNLDNYWLRRPCHSSLEDYVMDDVDEKPGHGSKHGADEMKGTEQVQADGHGGTTRDTNIAASPARLSPQQDTRVRGRGGVGEVPISSGPTTKTTATTTTTSAFFGQQPKQAHSRYEDPYDAQPKPHQVRALKATFQKWVDETTADDQKETNALERESSTRPAKRPRLEAATLTWVYTGISNTTVY